MIFPTLIAIGEAAPSNDISINILLSILAVSLAGMGTLIKIFGKRKKVVTPEEMPGKTPYCIQHKVDLTKNENLSKETADKQIELRQVVNDLRSELVVLKSQSDHTNKTVDEMKQNTKEIAMKLDDLLKQLLESMND